MSIRAFIAIELSLPVRELFEAACRDIRELDPRWRDEKWVRPENLHVTVKFLGSVERDDLNALSEAVAMEVAGLGPFALPVDRVRAVPRLREARMIWATLSDPEGRCSRLAAAAERGALFIGVPLDERSFTPHVTLVRARRPHAVETGAVDSAQRRLDAFAQSMSVPRLTLFASRTLPTGPVYEKLKEWPLDQA